MSPLQPNQTIHNFTLTNTEPIAEINGTAYTLQHSPTGAQLLYLNTEDDEKGFAIGFRTCPSDNTGVFHILEHSVLCGSDKYPVKEPFVTLLKSSMKTFLNAATGPDFTVFPVASTNEKDLMNLMSVYLDAVFHPAILREPRIFKQEGWHLEYDGENITTNGVVYNEMKGMMAQPDRVILNALKEELFPNAAYQFEPGGIPSDIATLTYEQFIDTYKRHYRPENAAIVLYGQLDLDTFLPAIDEQLLSVHDKAASPTIGDPNPRGAQKPVISTDRKVSMNTLPQNAELMFGTVFADADDTRRALAMEILGHALLGTNESPLKRMLIDTGISSDFAFHVHRASKHVLLIIARGVKPDSANTFLNTIKNGCRELLAEGLQKDQLRAAAFQVEFEKRSNSGNGRPAAADQMMDCLERWGAGNPLDAGAVCYNADLEFLKSVIETDYYDNLLREAILDSAHYALVELCPTDEEQQSDDATKEGPAAIDFDADELERIACEAADLKAFQDSPDSPEALGSIPRLNRADCIEAPHYEGYEPVKEADVNVLRHEYAEDGIAHIIRFYDISSLSLEDLYYVKTLIWIISETDTLRHNAAEVVNLKHGRLGGINAGTAIETDSKDGSLCAYVWVYTCSLAEDIEFTSDYVDEILHETVFANRSKLRETVDQLSQLSKMVVTEAGPHVMASIRAESHVRSCAVLNDVAEGSESYEFLKELKKQCGDDAKADDVLRRLEILSTRIFGVRPALISFSGDDDTYARFIAAEQSIIPKYEGRTAEILSNLSSKERAYACHPILTEVEPLPFGDEAFVIPGDVAYCAEAIDTTDTPSFKSGHWAIADRAATYDYLWNNVRVKGGAYGTRFTEGQTGIAEFHSFRDPNIDDTLRCFNGLSAWLREFEPTDDELDGYVVATTAEFDKPTKGFRHLMRQSRAHLFGWTLADREQRRREIVSCTADDVRQLGKELDECAGKRCSVVFASHELIEQSKHDFVVRVID